MWDNGGAEYSGAQSNTMTDALPSGCTPVGGAFALGSTDPMEIVANDRLALAAALRVTLEEAPSIRPDLGPCWVVTSHVPDANGYIRISRGRRTWSEVCGKYRRLNVRAHRLALELVGTPVLPDLVPDHLCRNHACCRPSHLEQVTMRVNTLRGENHVALQAAQTCCLRGHEFTAENTRLVGGKRHCRTCERAGEARRKAVARAPAAQPEQGGERS